MKKVFSTLAAYLVAVLSLSIVARRAMPATGNPGGHGSDERLAMSVGRNQTQSPANAGFPTPSDTFNPANQGTDWPFDAFTAMVVGHQSPDAISSPALHSYAGDGNMEALSVFPPHNQQENRTDLGSYTGAVGPAGGSTPESHPEITAP